MKIVHLTVVRKLTQGQTKQLQSEHEAATRIKDVDWVTVGLQSEKSDLAFVEQIPTYFRPILLRNLFGWLMCLRYSGNADFVLLRHMTFDPFAFIFAPFIKNRISVHHAKEIDELKLIRRGWKGRLASVLERYSGRFTVRRSRAIFGVTGEIARYEQAIHKSKAKTHTFPNGIDLSSVEVLDDKRHETEINVAFLCGSFSSWHGVDLLDNALQSPQSSSHLLKIHLIGSVPEAIKDRVESNPYLIAHGLMDEVDYRKILDTCDYSLSSFALFRKGLQEAATLKNREMLAMGLPILSGHIDTALPKSFQYHLMTSSISQQQLVNFGIKMKSVSRETVRDQAKPYIEKEMIMRRAATFLATLEVD